MLSVPLFLTLVLCITHSACCAETAGFPAPAIEFEPEQYVCYRTAGAITVDGRLTEHAWQAAPTTALFVDIEGPLRSGPRFDTQARMLWDDDYFYVAAELEEPDVWAKLDYRDAIIYYDNDFEVFIDPDGDTHEYYELEVNAYSTEWDLFLVKPYRDGGPALHAWDIQGLQTAVWIDGTLNQPGDRDKGWTVEIAIPWSVLRECAHRDAPPRDGDQWRVNFSRVEWHTEVSNGVYHKAIDPASGNPLPEDNWVWSAQGLINMHYPEMWGYVQFSGLTVGAGTVAFRPQEVEQAAWRLRQLYYLQRAWYNQHQRFADWSELSELPAPAVDGWSWPPVIERTSRQFSATCVHAGTGLSMTITQDGRLIRQPDAD